MNEKEKLVKLQRQLGYQFKNNTLLIQALTHKSANHQHNERLEFLGDSILNFTIAELLFQRFPRASEGELTRARASLVNKTTLFQIALEFDLGEYLLLGIGEKRSGGFRRESILADAFEAVIGAIYLDSGFEACFACIKKWFINRLATIEPANQLKDPKTELQEWLQAQQKPLPKYQVMAIAGEQHEQTFTVSCQVEAFAITVEASGASRRVAEQIAARKILEAIK